MQAVAANRMVTERLMSHKQSVSYIQDRMPCIKFRPATGLGNTPKSQQFAESQGISLDK